MSKENKGMKMFQDRLFVPSIKKIDILCDSSDCSMQSSAVPTPSYYMKRRKSFENAEMIKGRENYFLEGFSVRRANSCPALSPDEEQDQRVHMILINSIAIAKENTSSMLIRSHSTRGTTFTTGASKST